MWAVLTREASDAAMNHRDDIDVSDVSCARLKRFVAGGRLHAGTLENLRRKRRVGQQCNAPASGKYVRF
jgi:hypothetical protein